MRTALLGLFVAMLAGTGVLTALGGGEACAQGGAPVVPRIDCEPGQPSAVESCAATSTVFRSVAARPRGRSLRLTFSRRARRAVRIDVFRVSDGRTVLGNRRVARLRRSGTLRGRRLGSGYYFVRFRSGRDDRRIALRRSRGRFRTAKPFYRRASCGAVTSYKLERPVFGGRSNRALGIAFRVRRAGTVGVEVRRAGRVVRRFRSVRRRGRITHRLRLPSERLRRGTYEVRLTYVSGGVQVRTSLFSRRL